VAIEAAAGRLTRGETYVHESMLGLKFVGQIVKEGIPRADGGPSGIIPSITARSFLMGTNHWVLHPEDPFRHGFVF
jgi:proline racemase